MRVLAIIANIALLGVFFVLISNKGMPRGGIDTALASTLVIAPVLNLIVLTGKSVVGAFKTPELIELEIEARKAKLRKQINDAGGHASTAPKA